MVSSTVGGSTITVWNRRSSAPSFSIYLRYSLRVEAPTHCSSPRASAGFSMFDASTAPSAAPAPTSVWSSSMNRMMLRFCAISLMIALSRQLGEIGAEVIGGRGLRLLLALGARGLRTRAGRRRARRHLAAEQPQRLGARLLQVDARVGQHLRGDPLLLPQQAEQ